MARRSPTTSAQRPAKFLPPRPRHPLPRPRLHALLDDAAPARALWLQGQAGAGKSTLAAAWGAAQSRPMAWFRVDATDLDLSSAFAALAQLLGSATRRRLPPAVLRTPPLGDEAGLHAFARLYFRAFHATGAPMVLVFDDVHAAPSPAFEGLLLAALDEAPPDNPVLITSRQPPQGVLLEAVARGELWVLGGEALNFSADEAQALLAPRLGAERAAQLHQRTGGWAAGLTLLAAQPDSPDQAEQTVADFFSQRVLGRLTDGQRQLLAAVSLLPEVDEPALQALGLGADAPDQLDQLCDLLGFVQRLRAGQRCWRLHDLLKHSVQAHWHGIGTPAWRRAMQQAAAQLLAQQSQLQAAVGLLASASLGAQALTLWLQHARGLLRQGRALEIQRAHAQLDPALTASHGPALTLRGMAAWLAQDADTGDWFDRSWAALDAAAVPADSADRLLTASAALNAQFSGWRSYAGRQDWVARFLAGAGGPGRCGRRPAR